MSNASVPSSRLVVPPTAPAGIYALDLSFEGTNGDPVQFGRTLTFAVDPPEE